MEGSPSHMEPQQRKASTCHLPKGSSAPHRKPAQAGSKREQPVSMTGSSLFVVGIMTSYNRMNAGLNEGARKGIGRRTRNLPAWDTAISLLQFDT